MVYKIIAIIMILKNGFVDNKVIFLVVVFV
jgi:hypothetical protein